MPEDILDINENDFSLNFWELLEGVFRFPKETMTFVYAHAYSKYVWLIYGLQLVLSFLAGAFVTLYYLITYGFVSYVLGGVYTILYEIFYLNIIYIIFLFALYVLLKMDKIQIAFLDLVKYFIYALIPLSVSMFLIALFSFVVYDLAKFQKPEIMIKLFRFAALIWSMFILYYGISNHTHKKSMIAFVILVSLLLTSAGIYFVTNQ